MFESFQYQLQRERFQPILDSQADLVIVDVDDSRFTPEQVAAIAGKKTILSYLSVGQASNVRWYWDKSWVDGNGDAVPGRAPSWLGRRSPHWAGAYEVRYWEPEWLAILQQGIDRVLDAGYAGVVYDAVDAFGHWGDVAGAPDLMKQLVMQLMAYGESRKPGYIGIPNSGYPLLVDDEYLASISAQLAESVFFKDGMPRPDGESDWAIKYLNRMTEAGKQVLLIEYLAAQAPRQAACAKARAWGYVPYMARQQLDTLEPTWQSYA